MESTSNNEIGIKLAKDLESIEDERIMFNARLAARDKIIDDARATIYYLAEKLINKKVVRVWSYFENEGEEGTTGNEAIIDGPTNSKINLCRIDIEI